MIAITFVFFALAFHINNSTDYGIIALVTFKFVHISNFIGQLVGRRTFIVTTSGEHQKYAKKCAKTQPHSKRHKHSIDEDKIEKYIE